MFWIVKTKVWIKKIFKLFNFEINKIEIKSILNKLQIGYVIDVGANSGQFAQSIREKNFLGTIYSFEPLGTAHVNLTENSKKDKNWHVHSPVALGSFIGRTSINVTSNSVSSSIKKMMPIHLRAARESFKVKEQHCKMITLDSEIERWKKIKQPIYLKIDTQGYEKEVLDGSGQTLSYCVAVQLEMSCVELYEGQKLFQYFFTFFRERKFTLYDITPMFKLSSTGQMLQFDAVFVKNSYLKKLGGVSA